MSNPGGLIVVVPFAWGLYKCSVLAQRPTMNKKAVYALALMLGVWSVLLTVVTTASGPAGDAQLLAAAAILFTAAPIVAIVLAIVGLWEIRLSKRSTGERRQTVQLQGTGQAVGALLLASALIVPFAGYAGAYLLGRRAAHVVPEPSPGEASAARGRRAEAPGEAV